MAIGNDIGGQVNVTLENLNSLLQQAQEQLKSIRKATQEYQTELGEGYKSLLDTLSQQISRAKRTQEVAKKHLQVSAILSGLSALGSLIALPFAARGSNVALAAGKGLSGVLSKAEQLKQQGLLESQEALKQFLDASQALGSIRMQRAQQKLASELQLFNAITGLLGKGIGFGQDIYMLGTLPEERERRKAEARRIQAQAELFETQKKAMEAPVPEIDEETSVRIAERNARQIRELENQIMQLMALPRTSKHEDEQIQRVIEDKKKQIDSHRQVIRDVLERIPDPVRRAYWLKTYGIHEPQGPEHGINPAKPGPSPEIQDYEKYKKLWPMESIIDDIRSLFKEHGG